jgi:HEPN domain-containing protein
MLRNEIAVEVHAWIEKAESDLKAVDLLIAAEDSPVDVVCFHAQQVAEKYLKAALTGLGIQFPKTHDLAVLLGMFPQDSLVPHALVDLSELTDVAVSVRYPGYMEDYSRETAEDLIRQARQVKSVVIDELNRIGCPAKGDTV